MCCRHSQQILLLLSIHATCFGSIDHPQEYKYMILKLKIKCIYYILNFMSVCPCIAAIAQRRKNNQMPLNGLLLNMFRALLCPSSGARATSLIPKAQPAALHLTSNNQQPRHRTPQEVITHIQSRATDDGHRSARNMLNIL